MVLLRDACMCGLKSCGAGTAHSGILESDSIICCQCYAEDISMALAERSQTFVLQLIWSLENEREARGQEATEASQRHAQALEEVKLRDMAAADLQKKVTHQEHLLLHDVICVVLLRHKCMQRYGWWHKVRIHGRVTVIKCTCSCATITNHSIAAA